MTEKKKHEHEDDHHITMLGPEEKYAELLDELAKWARVAEDVKNEERLKKEFWGKADEILARYGLKFEPSIAQMYKDEDRWPRFPSPEAILYFKQRLFPRSAERQRHFFILWDIFSSGGRP